MSIKSVKNLEIIQTLTQLNTCPRTQAHTCADHHSLDQFACVKAGLDDVGATEECVSLMLLCVVGTVIVLVPLSW